MESSYKKQFKTLAQKNIVRETGMCLRAELISFFLQEEVNYDLQESDKDFFYQMPKLKFCKDG